MRSSLRRLRVEGGEVKSPMRARVPQVGREGVPLSRRGEGGRLHGLLFRRIAQGMNRWVGGVLKGVGEEQRGVKGVRRGVGGVRKRVEWLRKGLGEVQQVVGGVSR